MVNKEGDPMRSFSSSAKAEICRTVPQSSCCAFAECFGILLFCNSFRNDSIKIINYNITFTINEEGRIINPKIANNENSCTPCEKELLRVIKNAPTVTPAILNDQKIKLLYSLPFKITLD